MLHFASPASPIDYLRLPIQTLKVGALGTHKALGLARAKNARFLLASTSEVYGDPLVHPQNETYWGNVNPVGLRGVYDEAKRYAEALTMAYQRYHGVDVKIVRIFNTFGPRMRKEDGRAVPNFIMQALRGEPLTIYGDGSQTRSFGYITDLVRGLHLLRHVGPQRAGQHRQSAGADRAGDGRADPEDHREQERDGLPAAPGGRPQGAAARHLAGRGAPSGWEPEVDVREALRLTVEWFRRSL